MKSNEIRNTLKQKKIKQWELARAAKISEYTLIRWLREDLTKDREKIITAAMKELDYAKRVAKKEK